MVRFTRNIGVSLVFLTACFVLGTASAAEIKKVDERPSVTPIAMHVVGRISTARHAHHETAVRMQWPGVYFETTFDGTSAYVELGDGRAIFHVIVDGEPPLNLISSAAAMYRIGGLAEGRHTLRLELATECQGGAVEFVGFSVPTAPNSKPIPAPQGRPRQIEFIGDSHTVGYGNTSAKRQCTPDEIWATTDTSRAFGPLVAKHYDADYEINAISGRGIVRNYNGGPGETLPEAYAFSLFDHHTRIRDAQWSPDVIVVALGTNDFSTKLNAGERWKTRDELHADYEQTYVNFVSRLRSRHPVALLILAANDMADGEIATEVRNVIARLRKAGDLRVDAVEFTHLELTACNWHPSLQDHLLMAAAVERTIDAHRDAWRKSRR